MLGLGRARPHPEPPPRRHRMGGPARTLRRDGESGPRLGARGPDLNRIPRRVVWLRLGGFRPASTHSPDARRAL